MTRSRRPALRMLAALAAASLLTFLAQARNNPYEVIVERNPFNLKPIPPPTAETNQIAATPPVKVVLTGITSMFGTGSERAFVEMTEQPQPGKPAATPIRSMLRAGDREGDIEVLSIDIGRNIVKIRNAGAESELTFEVPKPSATPAGQAGATTASLAPAAPASTQPIIVSSSESRGGITMAGGGGGFQGNSAGVTSFGGSTPLMAGNSGGVSSYGGVSPSSVNPGLAGGSTGLGAIPSRTIRTPTFAETKVDREQQMLLMEANRIRNDQINQGNQGRGNSGGRGPSIMPPMPPTDLSRELYGGGGGPPGPPGFPGQPR